MAHSGKTMTFATDLVPQEDSIYSLGYGDQRWKIYGELQPLATKTYNAPLYQSSGANFYQNFATVTPVDYNAIWIAHYRITITAAGHSDYTEICDVSISGRANTYYSYKIYNSIVTYSIYQHMLLNSNSATVPHELGYRMQGSYGADNVAKVVKVELLEQLNCTVTLLNDLKLYTSATPSGYTWRGFNSTSNGLQEAGDVNDTGYYILSNGFKGKAGSNKVYRYCLFARTGDGTYESFVMQDNTVATTKTVNPHGFVPDGKIYWNANNTVYSEGTFNLSPYQQYHALDYRYSFNFNNTFLPDYCETYVVYTYNEDDGLLYLDTTQWLAAALPTTADGKIYQRIGSKYYTGTSNYYQGSLLLDNPYYEFKNGKIRTWAPSTRGIKSITRSGTTFTATRDDGSTFNFTQQDTNKYHKTGSWGGTNNLTYTATAVNSADALAFTLATASTNAYGATKLSSATDSDSEVLAATPKAIKTLNTKMDGLLAAANAMTFKGVINATNALPNSHNAGDTYRVGTAGTYPIVDSNGRYCEVGTLIICVTDGTAANAAHWTAVETNEDGAVISSSTNVTDNVIARFDGATGRIIQDSKVTIDDNGNLLISHATSATMTADSTNPKITFAENGSQPVHLIYTDYDNYRAPAGLKIIGGTSATPAWLEVEGNTWSTGFKITGKTTSLTDNNLTFSQGGGWSMSDSTWIRTVGSKSVYMNTGTFRNDGTTQLRTLQHVNANIAVDGSWTTGTTGTANSGDGNATQGALGTSILAIGNATARPAAGTAGGANNAKGYLYIYGAGSGYGELTYNDSMFASNKSIYLTNTANSGINNEIRGLMASNDYWRVAGGATASNAGYMEIATADDGNEPIYVRQYTGVFTTVKRTLTLLDASGDSSFPGEITASGAITANNFIIPSASYHVIQKLGDTSNWGLAVGWNKTTAYTETYLPGLGFHNTGGTGNGSISLVPYATNTGPWGGSVGLFLTSNTIKFNNNIIPNTNNTSGTVGSASQPVYINAGVITACKQPTSGAFFSSVPLIGNDGVMEIGKYIDFHTTNNGTSDYDVRITAATTGLTISGTTSGTFSGNLSGNATSANRLSQTTITSLSSFTHTTDLIYAAVAGSNSVADKPSGVDAFGVLSYKTASGWYGQILTASNTGSGIYWRTGTTLSGGWKKLLDSSNYTDYTVTKTGTGASGTWGISISGNAATATSATSATSATTATTASKLGSSTVGSARQAIYLDGGTATAGNYTVAHLGNAGKSNMNDVGRLHASVGMTNLTDPSNNTDNPMNGTTKSTSWHLYWNANYTDDPNGSNAWVAQIVNKAGTAQWWVRSRSGGTITNGTAWAADWKHLVVSPQAGQGSSTVPIYIDANGHTQSITSYSGNAATATTATNLSAKPSFAASGNNITVTAGEKTSDAFTVPYATTANYLTGFSSRSTSMGWGNQTGSVITCFATPKGGGWGFRDDNPAAGQVSMTIDGTIYIKEGGVNIADAVKSFSVSGQTVTYTNLWGGTGTFTTQDTKNTAGSTNSDSKLYLIGAASQAANPQTYSDAHVFETNGAFSAKTLGVNADTDNDKVTLQWNSTDNSLDFVFA